MGNCLKSRGKKKDDENLYEGSKDQSLNLSSKPENPKAAVKGNQPKSWEIRKAGLKREDFEFVLRENETLIKPPGSINGQRFVIDSCKNCNIFLADFCDSVEVDDCVGCSIFVGPCSSSVFVRNVKECNIVMIAQQLRTRDCKNLLVLLYSQTFPVIELTDEIKFACYQGPNYEGLEEQMARAKLNIWNNKWSEIYDFNPPAPNAPRHYSLYPSDAPEVYVFVQDFFHRLEHSDFANQRLDVATFCDTIPLTTGLAPVPGTENILVVILPSSVMYAKDLIPSFARQGGVYLKRTRVMKLSKDQISNLFLNNPHMKSLSTPFADRGEGTDAAVQDMLDAIYTQPDSEYHKWQQPELVKTLTNLVFEAWKEDPGQAIARRG